MSRPIITLTTDFGITDSYVGAMKGVILSRCPEATLVDICHNIEPQAVRQAAYVLSTAVPYFPPGTTHLVVVDPGVGSARRPLVVRTGRATYVAPDNGVLSLVLGREAIQIAVHLTDPRYHLPEVSATFHGRDVFAPAAAHLAAGVDPAQMGERLSPSDLVTLPVALPQPQAGGAWLGEVFHIDHFGNLVTSFTIPDPPPGLTVTVGGQRIESMSRTYSDVAPGQLVFYKGSSGHLEIALREGSAAAALSVSIGDPVQVEGLS